MKLLSVTKSTRKDKKWMAEFDTNKIIHFGARGMDDYTLKKDKEQRERYRARHASGKTAKPDTADSLSFRLLWGESTSLQQNIKDYKKKYNL
tara:strand:- start:110 stop:385 length:276 start_codon:yes stop_codon:yes gene_type:complete